MNHYIEDANTELKREYTDEIKKTAVAFANTSGGKIFIGIGNDGDVVGVADYDKVSLQVVGSLKNAIRPDITMFVKVEMRDMDGKSVVVVNVDRGSSAPYYLADHGLKPSGVYVRVGSASVPASEERIRKMIKDTDGDKYIEMRSMNQDLTFTAAEEEFKKVKVKFEQEQQVTLGILDSGLQYTNLGLLLSDQCQHTIKVAVFEGNTKSVFKSRKEFEGSLFRQLNEALEYIDYFNLIHAEIGMKKRVERLSYPRESIREAVLNAAIHREYAFSGSTLINIYDNRIEVASLGGLVSGITLEAAIKGVSQTRNERLAKVFYKLEWVEAYGTGLVRIWETYSAFKLKPTIDVTDSSFIITLPNMTYSNGEPENEQKTTLIEIIRQHGNVTREAAASELGVGVTRCHTLLTELINEKKIAAKKNGKKFEYHLI